MKWSVLVGLEYFRGAPRWKRLLHKAQSQFSLSVVAAFDWGRSAPELRNQRLLERFLFDEREPPRRVELQDARPLPVLAKVAPHMLRVVLIRIYIYRHIHRPMYIYLHQYYIYMHLYVYMYKKYIYSIIA